MAATQNSVVYIDRRARDTREFTATSPPDARSASAHKPSDEDLAALSSVEEVNENIHCLLSTFSHVFVHRDAETSLAFLESLDHFLGAQSCILILIHTPADTECSPGSEDQSGQEHGSCGEHVWKEISSRMKSGNLNGVLLPVALVSERTPQATSRASAKSKHLLGALDILPSPLTVPLPMGYAEKLAKKAQHDAKLSKQEQYSNMTQDLVEKLLGDLANGPSLSVVANDRDLQIDALRRQEIVEAFNNWSFPAHCFTDAELTYGVSRVLLHALQQPELEKWHMTEDDIIDYVSAVRITYKTSVIYHNFHHACDVLQAVFHFLVSIGTIPPLLANGPTKSTNARGLATVIRPIDVLTLLIAAIGHDVGHPGVNNLFLVKVKAAVAQLYNDHSVLESYHCAASSRLLRHYWPAAYCDLAMRKLMISSILATDMTLHSQYTNRLDILRKTWIESGNEIDSVDQKTIEEHRELICCLLIKCADICNVARPFNIAKAWAILVTDEFAHQGELEKDAEIPSCLFGGPPARGDFADLAKRQMGFIGAFALDLFKKITEILPSMQFTVDTINQNKETWQILLKNANEPQEGRPFDLPADGRRGSQVPPAQPQEVPDTDPRKEPIPPSQLQAARPSVPFEVPESSLVSSEHGSDDSTATDEKPRRLSSRPSSSSHNGTSSSFSRYTMAPGPATGAPLFTQPFPRSLQESSSSRRSPGGATQSPKLAHVKAEPRRSSLGNINLSAPSETQDSASRRSSGTYSYDSELSSPSKGILSSRIISPSQLRVDGSDETVARDEDAGSITSRPFSFSSGSDAFTVRQLCVSEVCASTDTLHISLESQSCPWSKCPAQLSSCPNLHSQAGVLRRYSEACGYSGCSTIDYGPGTIPFEMPGNWCGYYEERHQAAPAGDEFDTNLAQHLWHRHHSATIQGTSCSETFFDRQPNAIASTIVEFPNMVLGDESMDHLYYDEMSPQADSIMARNNSHQSLPPRTENNFQSPTSDMHLGQAANNSTCTLHSRALAVNLGSSLDTAQSVSIPNEVYSMHLTVHADHDVIQADAVESSPVRPTMYHTGEDQDATTPIRELDVQNESDSSPRMNSTPPAGSAFTHPSPHGYTYSAEDLVASGIPLEGKRPRCDRSPWSVSTEKLSDEQRRREEGENSSRRSISRSLHVRQRVSRFFGSMRNKLSGGNLE